MQNHVSVDGYWFARDVVFIILSIHTVGFQIFTCFMFLVLTFSSQGNAASVSEPEFAYDGD